MWQHTGINVGGKISAMLLVLLVLDDSCTLT